MESQTLRTKQTIGRAVRALLSPLQENWRDIEGFAKAATPLIQKEAGAVIKGEEDARAVAQEAFRQAHLIHDTHFRFLETYSALDSAYQNLEGPLAQSASPVAHGALWLAYRIQQAAVTFVTSMEAQNLLKRVGEAFREQGWDLVSSLDAGDEESTLESVEQRLYDTIRGIASNTWPFNCVVLAIRIVELSRQASRKGRGSVADEMGKDDSVAFMAGALRELVYRSELNEARVRFSHLSSEAKTKAFNEFRRRIGKVIDKASNEAPRGFEALAEAVEKEMFPYPQRLQWIRAFIRPLYSAAEKANLFEGCSTPRAINARGQAIKRTNKVNATVLELARTMALASFAAAERQHREAFLTDVDLVGEFEWPATVADLKARMPQAKA